MIAQLTGIVATAGLGSVVLDVAGVGYLLHTTPRAAAAWKAGEKVTAHTSLVVREDSLTLFAFDATRDKETFEILVSVQGIGPRLALAILSVHSAEQIAVAAASGDTKAFTQVPGIGPKGAQRIVLELKGKLTPLGSGEEHTGGAGETGDERGEQVIEALTGLGWSEKDAEKAVAAALKHDDSLRAADVPALLRAVLASIGRGASTRGAR